MKFILTILSVLAGYILHAQTDSVMYTRDFVFKEGIYITIEDLKNNNPTLTPENFKTYNPDADYLEKSKSFFKQNRLHYPDSLGSIKEKHLKNLFGYSANNILYMFNGSLVYRIFKLGIISYGFQVGSLLSNKPNDKIPTGSHIPFWVFDPYETMLGYDVQAQQYFLDYKNGKVYEYNRKYFEILLKDADLELYLEYSKLSNSKKKKMMFIYLNKINQKHPIYFKN